MLSTTWPLCRRVLATQGNYECSPSAMLAVINDCCTVKRLPPGAAAAGAAGVVGEPGFGGGEGGGEAVQAGPGALPGGGAGGDTVFFMNGFHLHRNKSQVSPAFVVGYWP